MSLKPVLLAAVASVVLAGAAAGHHSPAAYDLARPAVLEGVLAAIEWKNPHIYLILETPGPEGAPVRQQVEAGPISTLQPLGITRDTLKVGDRVAVLAAPHRAGAGRTVLGMELTTADGSVYPLGASPRVYAAPVSPFAEGLDATWLASVPSFAVYIQGRQAWPLTEAGRAGVGVMLAAAGSAEDDCRPLPPPTPMLYPVVMTLEISEGEVVIRPDWLGLERRIPLDVDHADGVVPSLMGDSVGFLEGDVLIVDTVGFTPHPQGLSMVAPGGADKHLVERFELAEDGRSLRYQAILEDPDFLSAPVTVVSDWAHRPDLTPTGEACDLEIARRYREDRAGPPAAVD
jgi:hypothetical protein